MIAATLEAVEYSDAPAVLVFSDETIDRGQAELAVRAAGARLVATLPIGEAKSRLDVQAGLGVVFIEVAEDPGPPFDALLDRIEREVRERRYAAVIAVPTALIDVAAARISHPDIAVLADPDQAQRTAAVAMACATRRMSLRDIGGEGSATRLIELSEEVGRIARSLAALSNAEAHRKIGAAEGGVPYREDPEAAALDAATVRGIIRTRRLRDQYFQPDLFADPAWDMLLDLTAARLEGRGVAVSSLCIAAAVPPTTALRWIRTMTDSNIFVRRADPIDGRRVFIELAEPTARAMTAYLAAARQICTMTV